MSKKTVPVVCDRFLVAPANLLQYNRNYIWVFLILMNKANSQRSTVISGDELIELSGLSPTELRDALYWLMLNGYVRRTYSEEKAKSVYLLSVEGALPHEVSNSLRPSSNQLPRPTRSAEPIKAKNRKFVATLSGSEGVTIPPQLSTIASGICDFFNNHKGGAKTKRSFYSLTDSLIRILEDPGGGIEAVRKQLDSAIEKSKSGEKKWDSITYQNWDKFGREKKPHWEQNTRPSTQQIVSTFEEDIAGF
jgi:hypothetical protein